ncbi:MAG: DUF434 domain-containing protein [Armatimonadetes bacterium]|nr:DUF434 domain-containing protein [Armatimonadota bacterium]
MSEDYPPDSSPSGGEGEQARHRGANSQDARLFGPAQVPALRQAVADLSWLLGRGYAVPSALKPVGDRYRLHERQRLAVARASCPDARRDRRAATRLNTAALRDQDVIVDGFNLLITVEAALSGGVLLRCRDGCVRDMSSVHGSYRAVAETERALTLIGDTLAGLGPRSVTWLLDSPISNSGRLAQRLRELAAARDWPCRVEVLFNPDRALIASPAIAVTSDANVLDGVARWANLGAHLVEHRLPPAWLIDLTDS